MSKKLASLVVCLFFVSQQILAAGTFFLAPPMDGQIVVDEASLEPIKQESLVSVEFPKGMDPIELNNLIKTHLQRAMETLPKKYQQWAYTQFKDGNLTMLGWIDLYKWMTDQMPKIKKFSEQVRQEKAEGRTTDVVYIGQGGSIECIKTCHGIFGQDGNSPRSHIIDTIDPDVISELLETLDLEKTRFVVISKSLTTLEVLSLYKRFFDKYLEKGIERVKAAERFTLIVNEDRTTEVIRKNSDYSDVAKRGFYNLFEIEKATGGRYSWDTPVLLLASSIMKGYEFTERLREDARKMEVACKESDFRKNPGAQIAAFKVLMQWQGKNQPTWILPDEYKAAGPWEGQLETESLAKKEDVSSIMIDHEPLAEDLSVYGPKRYFLRLKIGEKDGRFDKDVERLEAAGFPVLTVTIPDKESLGQFFKVNEFATIFAGFALGVNPVNQPGVQLYKKNQKVLVLRDEPIVAENVISEENLLLDFNGVLGKNKITIDEIRQIQEIIGQNDAAATYGIIMFLAAEKLGKDYFANVIFKRMTPELRMIQNNWREKVRAALGVATLGEEGPCILHAKQQGFQDGENSGFFSAVRILEPKNDVPVPDTNYTFGKLMRAQALAMIKALDEGGRSLVRIDLKNSEKETIEQFDRFMKRSVKILNDVAGLSKVSRKCRKYYSILSEAIEGNKSACAHIKRVPVNIMIEYFEQQLEQTKRSLPKDIFGLGFGYDIRGNAQPIEGGDVNLTPQNFYIIGKTIGMHFAEKLDKVMNTCDIRNHSPILKYCLALGFASVGVNVDTSDEPLTTGAHNLLTVDNIGGYRAILQTSGSHGKPPKNGLKIKADLGDGLIEPVYAETLENLYYKAKKVESPAVKIGEIKEIDGLIEYVAGVYNETLPEIPDNTIEVIDCRGGAAGPLLKALLDKRGVEIIKYDPNMGDSKLVEHIAEVYSRGKNKIAVVLNMDPDPKMSAGIWDPSKPEALTETQRLVKYLNLYTGALGLKPAIGFVFDGDTDRVTAIKENGESVPAFEMTLPYYQRVLVDPQNQAAIAALIKAGSDPLEFAVDLRANDKLCSLIEKVNAGMQEKYGIKDRNFIEGWVINTGYPPMLEYIRINIKKMQKFVESGDNKKKLIEIDPDFEKNFDHLIKTYSGAEASGHNFYHISKKHPTEICDCAIAGMVHTIHIRHTIGQYEAVSTVPDLGMEKGKGFYTLTDLFNTFPFTFNTGEIRTPAPNNIKIKVAIEVADWLLRQFGDLVLPFSEPERVGKGVLKQPMRDGSIGVSGRKINLSDGRSLLIRWSNTGEEHTHLHQASNFEGLIKLTTLLTDRLRQESDKGVDVTKLEKEISRLKEVEAQYLELEALKHSQEVLSRQLKRSN